MADLEKGVERPLDRASQPTVDQKRRSSCLFGFCRLINFLTAICALLCAVAHGMALMVGEGSVQASLTELHFSLQPTTCTHTCLGFACTSCKYAYERDTMQGGQALTQQILRLYGIGFAVILGRFRMLQALCKCLLMQRGPVHAVCAEVEWERFLVTFQVLIHCWSPNGQKGSGLDVQCNKCLSDTLVFRCWMAFLEEGCFKLSKHC